MKDQWTEPSELKNDNILNRICLKSGIWPFCVCVYFLLESNIDVVVAMQRDCVWSEKYKINVIFARGPEYNVKSSCDNNINSQSLEDKQVG